MCPSLKNINPVIVIKSREHRKDSNDNNRTNDRQESLGVTNTDNAGKTDRKDSKTIQSKLLRTSKGGFLGLKAIVPNR